MNILGTLMYSFPLDLWTLEGVRIIFIWPSVLSEDDTLAVTANVKLYDFKDLKIEGN